MSLACVVTVAHMTSPSRVASAALLIAAVVVHFSHVWAMVGMCWTLAAFVVPGLTQTGGSEEQSAGVLVGAPRYAPPALVLPVQARKCPLGDTGFSGIPHRLLPPDSSATLGTCTDFLRPALLSRQPQSDGVPLGDLW